MARLLIGHDRLLLLDEPTSGVNPKYIDTFRTIIRDMGTSFATPVVCGLTACLWQALPNKTAMDIIQLIRQTSDNYTSPDNIYGYGKPNFWRAYMIGKIENRTDKIEN